MLKLDALVLDLLLFHVRKIQQNGITTITKNK